MVDLWVVDLWVVDLWVVDLWVVDLWAEHHVVAMVAMRVVWVL